jgi:ribonuclease BN (tRNA processing enzyme)
VRVVELDPDGSERSVEGTTVRAYGVDHGTQGGPFLALRLTMAGKVVAYTGDTAWTDVLLEVAAGADLFIAESYYWDKPVPFHLRHCDLLDHRDRITSVRTVLTHVSDDMLGHAAESPFELAHDGLSVPV